MPPIQSVAPKDNSELRRAVYAGVIFQLAPTPASQRLVLEMLRLLEQELPSPVREAQFRLSEEEFFFRIGRLRKLLYLEPAWREAVRAMMTDVGFDQPENAFDPLRLRAVTHCGYDNPRAAAVYYAHRDIWYAHPAALINWWMPLHDVAENETFLFFPDHLQRPVPNDSADFNYDEWTRDDPGLKIGWQKLNAGTSALYPATREEIGPGQRLEFSSQAGAVLLFSGAHLHQTRPNTSGRTRFSVDFRTVHLGDAAQDIGAPNVDNRSVGSALRDYVHPACEVATPPSQ